MKQYFSRKIKILFIFLLIVFAVVIAVAWQKYPFGVKQYKTITLGMPAAEKGGDQLRWSHTYSTVPEGLDFFVYSLGEEAMCIGPDCGIGGHFVECLGGWISGHKDIGEVVNYGLDKELINSGREKIITVADKEGKIVGIYPGVRIKNLPYILRNHRNLVSDEAFEWCSDVLLPGRW